MYLNLQLPTLIFFAVIPNTDGERHNKTDLIALTIEQSLLSVLDSSSLESLSCTNSVLHIRTYVVIVTVNIFKEH